MGFRRACCCCCYCDCIRQLNVFVFATWRRRIQLKSLPFLSAIVNRSGHDCPYSLRLMVCLLLYEITSFLRETYDSLPKLSSLHPTGMNFRQQQQRGNMQPTSVPQTLIENPSTLSDKRSNDRIRMGSVVSQTSNRSSVSISSEHPARMLILFFSEQFNSH